MHKKHLKFWWITITLLIVVALIGIGLMQKQNDKKITYSDVPVERGDIKITILSTGLVEPENRLEIKPPISGRVDTVLVDEGAKVRKGQILAWMSSTERAALIDTARSRGAEELKRWQELYRPTPIMAPIAGTIILRNVESGQTFTNVESVFVMSDRLTVKAQVDETDIAQIRLKQAANIVLDAYPNETIAAHVDKIAYDATTVNNVTTYIVDVLPDSTPETMRSGMTANVTFMIDEKKGVLTLPNGVIKTTADKTPAKTTVLMKVAKEGKPLEREVQIGLSDGKKSEIVSGLMENDVVLSIEMKLSPGSKKPTNPFNPIGAGRGSGRR
jgi:macrolide-specific efflux system membrane fusion protein